MSCNPYHPKLVFLSAPFESQVCALKKQKITVGRRPQNDLIINEPSVSQQHASFSVFGSQVIVRDLGSMNGTYVAGDRLIGQRQILHGQTVRFGNVTARLELERPPDDDTVWEESDVQALDSILWEQEHDQWGACEGSFVLGTDVDLSRACAPTEKANHHDTVSKAPQETPSTAASIPVCIAIERPFRRRFLAALATLILILLWMAIIMVLRTGNYHL